MVLEDKNVPPAVFEHLQSQAVAHMLSIDESLESFEDALSAHGLGTAFRLPALLKRFVSIGCKLDAHDPWSIDTPFLQQVRQIAKVHIQRELKCEARIPIPASYNLVGVPDEGPTHQHLKGYENVFCLPQGHIAACIKENPNDQPTWLEGRCIISRGLITDPGHGVSFSKQSAVSHTDHAQFNPSLQLNLPWISSVHLRISSMWSSYLPLVGGIKLILFCNCSLCTGRCQSLASCLGGAHLDGYAAPPLSAGKD